MEDSIENNVINLVQTGELNELKNVLQLRNIINDKLLSIKDGKGNSLWHIAAKHNQVTIFKWLCSQFNGQTPWLSQKNLSRLTPLYSGIKHESLDILEWMVENCVELKGQLVGKTSTGQTALHYSAKLGKSHSLNWLAKQYLVNGNNINEKEKGTGNTALHLAAKNNHLPAIKVLLFNGADLKDRNIMGMKAQDVARCNGNFEIADYLVAFECCLTMASETVNLEQQIVTYKERHHKLTHTFKQLLLLTKKLLRETAHTNDNCNDDVRFKAICEKWKRFNGKLNDVDQNRTPMDVVRTRFNESILKFDDQCSLNDDSNLTSMGIDERLLPNFTSNLNCFNGSKIVSDPSVALSSNINRSPCSSPVNFRKLDASLIEAKNLESLGLYNPHQFSSNNRSGHTLPKCSTTSMQCQASSISNHEQRNKMRQVHYQNSIHPSSGEHEGTTGSVDTVNLFLPLTPATIDMNSCLSANNCKQDTGLNVIECNSDMTSCVSTSRTLGRRECRQYGMLNDNKSNVCLRNETTLSDDARDQSQEGVDAGFVDKRRPFSLKFSIKKWFGPGGNSGESNSIVSDYTAKSVTDELTQAEIHETYTRASKNYSTVNFNASQDASSTELTSTTPTTKNIAMKCTESGVYCTTSATTSLPLSSESVNTSESYQCASSVGWMKLPANSHESVITDSQPISETSTNLLKTQPSKQSRSFTGDKSMNSVSSDQGEQLGSLNKVLCASKEALVTTPDLSRRHSPAPSEISKTESALLSPTSDSSKTESTNHHKKLTEKRNNSSKQLTTSSWTSATNEIAVAENASNKPTNVHRQITPLAVNWLRVVCTTTTFGNQQRCSSQTKLREKYNEEYKNVEEEK